MVPLVIGDAGRFTALREAFVRAGYTEAAICGRTGTTSIHKFKTLREGRTDGVEVNDTLDILIRLLMDQEEIEESLIRAHLPAADFESLCSLGVVEPNPDQPGMWHAVVILYPVAGLYAASDRSYGLDGKGLPFDAVYAAITGNTDHFLSMLPPDPCDDFLDLCSGTGIAAMVAGARYAKHAWAADLGARCVHFGEFNRLLNGLENVSSIQGDLYEAVGDRSFDRIVAHPPYIPQPQRQTLFRDGGEDGEEIFGRIIQGLPRHLRPGGRLYCVTLATDREQETLEQRIRKWLGPDESEFDVLFVPTKVERKPAAMIEAITKKTGAKWQIGERSELYERLKVTARVYGTVVVERRASARPVATARILAAPDASSSAVEWFRRWTLASADPDFPRRLLDWNPRWAQHMRLLVTHSPQAEGLLPSSFELRASQPFLSQAKLEPWVAVLVDACSGKRTVREIYGDLRRQEVVASEMNEAEFTGVVGLLISQGFLEVDQFRLPEAAAERVILGSGPSGSST